MVSGFLPRQRQWNGSRERLVPLTRHEFEALSFFEGCRFAQPLAIFSSRSAAV